MPAFVKPKDWARYKDIVNKFIDQDSGKQPFLWLNKINQPSPYGEDSSPLYIPTALEGLFQYNYIKTWANNSSRDTISGELDYSDMVLYISKNLLNTAGLLNPYGYWDFNWAEDRFIVNGKVYQPGGDTQVAQASEEALLFFVILQRVSPTESQKILNTYTTSTFNLYTSSGKTSSELNRTKIKELLGKEYSIGEDTLVL